MSTGKGIGAPENDMLFVVYQVAGTPGRDILTYCRKPGGYVRLAGARLEIRAGVHLMAGYSAHADRNGLLGWVKGMSDRPAWIKLVHGDRGGRLGLEEGLNSSFGF